MPSTIDPFEGGFPPIPDRIVAPTAEELELVPARRARPLPAAASSSGSIDAAIAAPVVRTSRAPAKRRLPRLGLARLVATVAFPFLWLLRLISLGRRPRFGASSASRRRAVSWRPLLRALRFCVRRALPALLALEIVRLVAAPAARFMDDRRLLDSAPGRRALASADPLIAAGSAALDAGRSFEIGLLGSGASACRRLLSASSLSGSIRSDAVPICSFGSSLLARVRAEPAYASADWPRRAAGGLKLSVPLAYPVPFSALSSGFAARR